MADDLAYPGLVGALIEKQAKSPYDRSFAPGEATTADVERGLLEMLLAGFGLAKGGALTSQSPQVAGSRRRLGPDVLTRNRTIRDQERDARPLGYPVTSKPRVGPTIQEQEAALNTPRRYNRTASGADTGGLDLFNDARLASMVQEAHPGARILSSRSPINGVSRDVELRLADGRVVRGRISNFGTFTPSE